MSPEKCAPDICWKGYAYVGPEPYKKGSCKSLKKMCKSANPECPTLCETYEKNKRSKKTLDIPKYNACLTSALKRFQKKKLKLCPRGYCTAKQTFDVYPSAYANGYAAQVCKGMKKDYAGKQEADDDYLERIGRMSSTATKTNDLQRWFMEKWKNVCEKTEDGEYKECGTGRGVEDKENYPYCRPEKKLPGTTVKTISELTDDDITEMCKLKRSLDQGVDGKPTRIFLDK